MFQKLKESLDERAEYVALLADLSKVFHCFPQDMIIAELHAYGFDRHSLKLIHNYLSERY